MGAMASYYSSSLIIQPDYSDSRPKPTAPQPLQGLSKTRSNPCKPFYRDIMLRSVKLVLGSSCIDRPDLVPGIGFRVSSFGFRVEGKRSPELLWPSFPETPIYLN